MPQNNIHIITSETNWIEGEAIRQLEKTAELPGIMIAVGLPELHPGKGIPVGAAFAAKDVFYPHLVGNDVGCGMGLWRTSLKRRKIRLDRWVDRLSDLDGPWDGDVTPWLEQEGASPGLSDAGLGTIGGGNHFSELQMVERVDDPAWFEELSLSRDDLVLLVHSGSRGLGESLLRSHVDKYKADGLTADSEEARRYLARHNHALAWAKANRALIAHRFLKALGADGERALDSCHNSIARGAAGGVAYWLHRKGVVPSEGATVIAGSRGSLSYLVVPEGDQELCLHSLTHGAGRKWKRGDGRGRLHSRYKPEVLTRTELGSRVICEDKDLLYEEAPQAYKDIETIIKVLIDAGLIRIVAVLRPVITYKTRRA